MPWDPGIPSDFVALSPSENPYDFIYWGPRKVLESYFADPSSLEVPLIRVKLSANVAQTQPKKFSKDFMEQIKQMKKINPNGFVFFETQWGDYPVLAIKALLDGHQKYIAWVGLNDPGAGWTLLFDLVYPNKNGHPTKTDCQLWQTLITETTQLKDGDYFKACGQDLQEGYTLVKVGEAKLKMTAEKRQSDGKVQVVVIPDNSSVNFHYFDMVECAMGASWKYKEPMVKVIGGIEVNKPNSKFCTQYVTSIFFKTVQEFSVTKDDGNKSQLIFEKHCELLE